MRRVHYAIEARNLQKSFLVPERQAETMRERVATRRLKPRAELMPALRGVSFDIPAGEFFGIVGRNGSGKSTLLKLMAGIYRADSGTIRAPGRIAPIIELGVGFNPELTATDNVLLNGVMMGLTERQARKRLFPIVDFAGLTKFMGMKLKNFSSGMRVRLAFSIMVHVDADLMLIDEVLAVGDGAFKAQSEAALRELNAAGRTIILVTHSMDTVEKICDRAMLLEGGEVDSIGDPKKIARRYHHLMKQRTTVTRTQARQPERDGDGDAAEPSEVEGVVL
jgi:ABC-type polysaccharide/polyol phosphate transport system ATPase subunit